MKINLFKDISKSEFKNAGLFLQGKLVSELFSSMYSFGSSLLVLDITGKGIAFAGSLVVSTLPKILFSVFAGAISDRVERKKMIVYSDIIAGLSLGLYSLLLSVTNISIVASIYIFNFLLSTISVFFSVSASGAIPQMVEKDNIVRFNSMNQAVSSISSILGPIAGGIIYGILDFKYFVFLNAISFILSAITEMFLVMRKSERKNIGEGKSKNKGEDLRICKEFLGKSQGILILILICSIMNFLLAFGFTVPMPYIVNNVFKMDSSMYGVLKTALVIGPLAGSILLSIYPLKGSIMKQYIRSIITVGLVYTVFGLVSIENSSIDALRFYIFYIIFFISSFSMVLINIPLSSLLQKNLPDDIRGKVLGFLSMILSVGSPIANILAGALLDSITAFYIPLLSGIIIILLGVLAMINKSLKNIN